MYLFYIHVFVTWYTHVTQGTAFGVFFLLLDPRELAQGMGIGGKASHPASFFFLRHSLRVYAVLNFEM